MTCVGRGGLRVSPTAACAGPSDCARVPRPSAWWRRCANTWACRRPARSDHREPHLDRRPHHRAVPGSRPRPSRALALHRAGAVVGARGGRGRAAGCEGQRRPLVYVTQGSTGDPELLRRAVEELVSEPVDVLVTTGGLCDPAELERLGPNVRRGGAAARPRLPAGRRRGDRPRRPHHLLRGAAGRDADGGAPLPARTRSPASTASSAWGPASACGRVRAVADASPRPCTGCSIGLRIASARKAWRWRCVRTGTARATPPTRRSRWPASRPRRRAPGFRAATAPGWWPGRRLPGVRDRRRRTARPGGRRLPPGTCPPACRPAVRRCR